MKAIRMHGLDLLSAGRAKNFRVTAWDQMPDNLKHEGRIFYSQWDNALRYTRLENGIIVPRVLLDSMPVWKDLKGPLNSSKTMGMSAPKWRPMLGNLRGKLFNRKRTEEAQVVLHMDHDYMPGTPVYPHVHWHPKNANDFGVVRLGIEISAAKGHGRGAFTQTETFYMEKASNGVKLAGLISEIDAPGWLSDQIEPDSEIIMRVFRDAKHKNDTAGDIFITSCDLHYLSDRNGTPQKEPDFYVS